MTDPANLPPLPATVPQRGNRLSRALGRFAMRRLGWRLAGPFPEQSKLVVVVAPHTSNWDFIVGIALVFATGLHANWLAKHVFFRPPLGLLARWLGGIAVDRSKRNDLVEQTTAIYRQRERIWLGITPEGTRKKVERWKSGFWHIAKAAGVPIALCYFDYRKREIGFGPLLLPGENYEADLARIQAFYADVAPRHPENF
ncbi:lysophospholipid acyltransferase family protein [Desulfuromonas sp. DDH964]|uniref:lysophospholipid acyltransferase family protein n=1 Tax=Desulfuromonas sp. DDH964 TaxID=1823759 RepID=UPI0018D43933|nr:lysophospholipid acyltransferase family protein [Desulfuromonas sp. DDH964]